jgi:hypothetical protein
MKTAKLLALVAIAPLAFLSNMFTGWPKKLPFQEDKKKEKDA